MTDAERLALLETTLHKQIRIANEAAAQPLSADDITNIVQQVIASLSGDVTAADLKFYAELEELSSYIRHAKQEIAAIQPKDINASHIPHATNELDAVVGATEDATNKIMDVCDSMTAIAGQCAPEISEQLIACTTRIYEACNFQDITGQRITKVVQTLKYIDSKVEALLKALGEEIHRVEGAAGPADAADLEKVLLNGPQLPQNAMDQATIDRLLADEK
ncbi:MAG: protein phosphatase CheZ [Alphaproteobacteria bacterium]|nr:protein phosphatase CheZ [Alphaproteobacteria bacterium]